MFKNNNKDTGWRRFGVVIVNFEHISDLALVFLLLTLSSYVWQEPKCASEMCIERKAFPVDIYMFKVNNRNTRTRCEICSKLTKKALERRHWRRSGVFIFNFEHILHFVFVFLLLPLNIQMPTGL